MKKNTASSLWLEEDISTIAQEHAGQADNCLTLCFKSRSENVAVARIMASSIMANSNITLAELDEIKAAVSEAVSNAIIHGYQNRTDGWVETAFELHNDILSITIHDEGIGIENIEEAMRPHFSNGKDRMGLGFAFMNSFMDEVKVTSAPLCGTTVVLIKKICQH